MRIVVLDGYTANPGDLSWGGLEKLGTLQVHDRTEPASVVPRAQGAEAVFVNKVRLDRETLEALPELRFVGVLATGYNVVDLEAALDLGITVTNVPDYSTPSVAQMVFALLLELCSHVGEHSQAVRSGQWSRGSDFCFWNHPLLELHGKRLGIVGLGRIGRQTARIAKAFGMEVVAAAPRPDRNLEAEGIRFVALESLLEQADVVSLHCPLTPETQDLIRRETLLRMKPEALLINTSRGGLIVEEDLAEALNAGIIAGAGLDVLRKEPPDAGNPLFRARNCIITPHIAWAPKEARERLLAIAASNLEGFLAGTPVNVVHP